MVWQRLKAAARELFYTTALLAMIAESVSIFGEPEPTSFQLSTNDSLCLNVTFVAALTIRYSDKDGRFLSDSAFIPRGSDSPLVEGLCEARETRFNISWSNETFVIRFHLDTFQKSGDHGSESRFWSVASVEMTLRNLPSASSDVFQLETKKGERHFATPLNKSYSCHEREEIDLKDASAWTSSSSSSSSIPAVVMEMWDVEIHPFVFTGLSNPTAFHCQEDSEKRARDENRASMIVAICLATLIVVILLVYGVTQGGRRIPYSNI